MFISVKVIIGLPWGKDNRFVPGDYWQVSLLMVQSQMFPLLRFLYDNFLQHNKRKQGHTKHYHKNVDVDDDEFEYDDGSTSFDEDSSLFGYSDSVSKWIHHRLNSEFWYDWTCLVKFMPTRHRTASKEKWSLGLRSIHLKLFLLFRPFYDLTLAILTFFLCGEWTVYEWCEQAADYAYNGRFPILSAWWHTWDADLTLRLWYGEVADATYSTWKWRRWKP